MKKSGKIVLLLSMMTLSIISIATSIIVENKNRIDTDNKRILILKIYENYAWSHEERGSFICTDGTIYTFDNSNIEPNMTSTEMIENSKLSRRKVSNRDMITLMNSVEDLEIEELKTRNAGYDMGLNAIRVFKEEFVVTIKQTGDFEGENKTKEAQRIIRIANKYLN